MKTLRQSRTALATGLRYVFSPNVFRRNRLLTAIVGCLLIVANQMDALLSQPFSMRMGTNVFFNF